MIGQTISHYKILEKLGQGGMGVVYKAKDLKLNRMVALKFLPPSLTADPEAKERFVQEAHAASSLQHENICTIHDIDETEVGQLFIVMDYYSGTTLKVHLAHGAMAIVEAVHIAMQIAQGLAEAHEKGIVHRDIKPANIMITEKGQVKIMDFGLAKLVGEAHLTRTGSTVGTVAYMSPEQARGEEVDHRSDIWSLGVVLYEMLTGKLPFRADYEAAMIYSILNENPQSLLSFRSDLPDYLEQIIVKSLKKDIGQRFQSMDDLLKDLKEQRLGIKESLKTEKSIIVIPFDDMSPNKDNEYFSDGLTEEIITDLSHVHELLVISRNSAMTFKGTKKRTKEIAKEVNVRYVLEGSVRKAGNNLRITAQLIDATTDTHLWAEKYSGTLDDVFDIQEKVSRSIVDALKIKLSFEEARRLVAQPIVNVPAYECYLRARRDMMKFSEEGLRRAQHELERGLEIVGENVLIYQGMAQLYILYYDIGVNANEETLQKAEDYVRKIINIEPDSSQSYYFLGAIERYRGSVLRGIEYFKKALIINPENLDSMFWLGGNYALQVGKPSVAEPLIKKVLKIDPLTSINYLFLGFVQWMKGDLDSALLSFQEMHKLEPEHFIPFFWSAYVLAWKEQYDKALEMIEQVIGEPSHELSRDIFAAWLRFFKHALNGNKEKALASLTDEARSFFWNDPDVPWLGACNYALIGEKEEALDWLERAVDRGNINYPLLSQNDPLLESIRGEERFKKLMERIKYEWEHFEV